MATGQYLLVDGHSVIFAWPDLRLLHDRDQAAARDQLARRLQHYQDYTGERVVLVFDGRGPVAAKPNGSPQDIQIFYSPSHKTADSIIERLTAKYASSAEMTVVTADTLERQTVISFGAACIDPDRFLDRLEHCEASLARDMKRLRQTL